MDKFYVFKQIKKGGKKMIELLMIILTIVFVVAILWFLFKILIIPVLIILAIWYIYSRFLKPKQTINVEYRTKYSNPNEQYNDDQYDDVVDVEFEETELVEE